MDARVWQRYVAVACSQAWNMDVQATELALDSDAGVVSITLRAQRDDAPDLEHRALR